MAETSKARARREREGFFAQYITGWGVDIGCGDDPLTPDCVQFDLILGSGDATFVQSLSRDSFDWVYASHILEHLYQPETAIHEWFSLLKPGGWLIIDVPHRDLYEKQSILPSRWNADHKFFLLPDRDEAPHTFSLSAMIQRATGLPPLHVRVLDEGYARNGDSHPGGEYSIEAIIQRPV